MPHMARTTLDVREAAPTGRDARAFAPFMEQASQGVFHEMLGSAAPRFLESVFVEPGHDLSYERVLIAERDGEIVGMASSHTTADHARESRRSAGIVARTARVRIVRMAAVRLFHDRLYSFMDVHEDGDSYLQAIAVGPEHRGKGVGRILIDAVGDRAVAAGSRRLTLDVDVTNHGAIALYRRMGWEIMRSSRPLPRGLGGTSVHRMVRPLPAT